MHKKIYLYITTQNSVATTNSSSLRATTVLRSKHAVPSAKAHARSTGSQLSDPIRSGDQQLACLPACSLRCTDPGDVRVTSQSRPVHPIRARVPRPRHRPDTPLGRGDFTQRAAACVPARALSLSLSPSPPEVPRRTAPRRDTDHAIARPRRPNHRFPPPAMWEERPPWKSGEGGQPEPTAAVSARDSVIPPHAPAARASETPFSLAGVRSVRQPNLTVEGLGRLTVSSLNIVIDRWVCSLICSGFWAAHLKTTI